MDCETMKFQSESSTPPTPAQPKRCRVSLDTVLLSVNAFLMVVILMAGCKMYHEFHHKADAVIELTTIFTANPSPKATEQVHQATRNVLSSVFSQDFFLGSPNGTIPDFLANVFTYDFATLGTRVTRLAATVQNAFNNQLPPECYQPYQCGTSGEFRCPNGHTRWCESGNDIINCASETCLSPYVVTAASLVQSVSQLISQLQTVSGGQRDTPAFSDSVFRLNGLFDWVESQTVNGDWGNSARLCQVFVNQVQGLDWSGVFRNKNGVAVKWNATREVREVTGRVNQICEGLAKLQNNKK